MKPTILSNHWRGQSRKEGVSRQIGTKKIRLKGDWDRALGVALTVESYRAKFLIDLAREKEAGGLP